MISYAVRLEITLKSDQWPNGAPLIMTITLIIIVRNRNNS